MAAGAETALRVAVRWALTGLLVVVLVMSLTTSARTAVIAAGSGTSPADLRAHAVWLSAQVDDGAAERMQELFPEGYLFTVVLTGLSLAATTPESPAAEQADVERLTELLEMADSPSGTAPFDPGADPPHGVFHAGWTLLLRVELARLSEEEADEREVRRRADVLRGAVDASPSGLLEAYPGQTWPVDTVVAVAALNRANRLLGISGRDPSTVRWLRRIEVLRDPVTGLLPHRTGPDGQVLDGVRGTSQSLIQLFWPDIDPTGAPAQWSSYVDTFVVNRVGAVGVREYSEGDGRGGDVDSGPLVMGMSASATVLTLGAARRNGDRALAADLDREAEVAGVPLELGGQRRYLAGILPVGDAFLAFTRAQRPGDPVASTAPGTWWWLHVGWPLVPAAGAAVLLLLIAGRRRGAGASAATRR